MLSILKEQLLKNNFNVESPVDNVLVVKNYLLDSEIDYFNDLINSTPEKDWLIEYMSNLKPFCLEKFGRDDVENLVAEGLFEITQNWEDKNLNISKHSVTTDITKRLNDYIYKIDESITLNGFGSIQRMQEGVELKCHTDQDTDPSIKYAAIIYLNNNYNEGKLFFKNKDLELKPEPGSLLLFPGDEEFHHGVRPVGEGPIRYVIVGFIKVIDYYEYDRQGNVINNLKESDSK
jgi:hypothetical protein